MNQHLTAALAKARIADLHGAAIYRSSETRRHRAVRALGLRFAAARLPIQPVKQSSP